MPSWIRTSVVCVGLVTASLAACDDEEKGQADAPCTADADCADGLTCDLHGGAEGTCQVPHEHGSVGGSGGESTGGSAAGGDAGEGGAAGGSSGGAGGVGASVCEAYCGCLEATCSTLDGYPFADEPACLTACEGFTAEELDCWGAMCEQAAMTPGALDHLCEHAWGEVGLAECR